jgi:hypothetical protein
MTPPSASGDPSPAAPFLPELFLLQHYFEEAGAAMYREDFIRKYGAAELRAALSAGLIEERCLPCRNGRARALCRLSDKGCRAALAMLSA